MLCFFTLAAMLKARDVLNIQSKVKKEKMLRLKKKKKSKNIQYGKIDKCDRNN